MALSTFPTTNKTSNWQTSLEIYTEVEIAAKAEKVWSILTNFNDYINWNPFIVKAEGKIHQGAKITIHVQPPGLKSMVFNPTIIKTEENRTLVWEGKFILPGMFDGEHTYIIEELGNQGVRLIQKETYTGLLIPFLAKKLSKNTRGGFELMNQAIKNLAESQPS
ncbi:SRPBCC domain-containing protein [Nostoc sp. UHCC 0302]|uniref:SRPBCC domain-containing protein n=1 Tax=Nostoc sp. UHCC 0302 TaxID=3134896 RepID=UPI00311C8F0A